MIKTKAGEQVVILDGSKKCITGKKPFKVRLAKIGPMMLRPFKLRKDELSFDSEDELWEAITKKEKEDKENGN